MRLQSFVVLAMLVVACKKAPEPDPAPRVTASASSSPATSAAAPLTFREKRELRIRLQADACNDPVKRVNVINGRKETDPAGVNLLSLCLSRGNVAWSRCIASANSKDDVALCNNRLLVDPPL